jgi:hypothetical protein
VLGRTAALMKDIILNVDTSPLRDQPSRVLFDSWARRVKRKETESLPVQVERR